MRCSGRSDRCATALLPRKTATKEKDTPRRCVLRCTDRWLHDAARQFTVSAGQEHRVSLRQPVGDASGAVYAVRQTKLPLSRVYTGSGEFADSDSSTFSDFSSLSGCGRPGGSVVRAICAYHWWTHWTVFNETRLAPWPIRRSFQ